MPYSKKGCNDEAIADFTEVIRLHPEDAEAYYSRGVVYGKNGDPDKAIADFTEAIRLNPKWCQAFHGRATVYAEKGEYDKAIIDFTETIRLNPEYANAYEGRGYSAWCLLNETGGKKNAKRAVELLQSSLQHFPSGDAQYMLGWCYKHGRGTKKNAIEAARLFRDAAIGGDAYAEYEWGNCLYYGSGVKKDREEAEKWYERAAEHGSAWTPENEKALRLTSFYMFCLLWLYMLIFGIFAVMITIRGTDRDAWPIVDLSVLFITGPVLFILGLCGSLKAARWGAVFMAGASIYSFGYLCWNFNFASTWPAFIGLTLLYGMICFAGVKTSRLMGQKAYWLERQRNGRIISFRVPIIVCVLVFLIHGIHIAIWKLFP